MQTVHSKFDFSDFEEEGYKKTQELDKAIYIFRDGSMWNGFSPELEGRMVDHGTIEGFLKDTSVDRYHPDFLSIVMEEFVKIVPESKTVLSFQDSYYSPEQLQTVQKLIATGYTQMQLESTLVSREGTKQGTLFHGSEQSFEKFELQKKHASGDTALGFGIYLTDNQEQASLYANNKFLYHINSNILEGRGLSNVEKTVTTTELSAIIQDIAAAQIASEGYPYILADFDEISSEDSMDEGNIYLSDRFAEFLFENDQDDLSIINEIYHSVGGDYGDSSLLRNSLGKLNITHGVQEFTNNDGQSSNEYVVFNPELIEITMKEDLSLVKNQQRASVIKLEDFTEKELNYLEQTISVYLHEQIDADAESDTFSDPSAYSNRDHSQSLLTKEERERADSWLSREVSPDNVMQLLEVREDIRSEQAYQGVRQAANEELAQSEELLDKDLDNTAAAFKEDANETLVDDHKSSLEQELTEAIASGDLKRIAEKRAELNQQKMEQLLKQNHQLEKQAIQEKEAAQLAKKEQGIDVYEDYLTKGKLSNEQLETLVSLDKELSAFDKVNVRLEAIERVKSANSGISLDNYEALLESIRADAGLLNELLDVEYYQMSTGLQNSTKQSLLSKNSMGLAIE